MSKYNSLSYPLFLSSLNAEQGGELVHTSNFGTEFLRRNLHFDLRISSFGLHPSNFA
jgi:hypothetical protein